MDFWQQVYHLSGLTLLDMTKEEPLGSLPLPLRSAVLAVAERIAGHTLQIEWDEDPTYGAASRYVKSWRWRTPKTTAAPSNAVAAPASLHEYYEQHGLLPQEAKKDEHFAERLFIERVFVPLFGLQALVYLQPQVTFYDADGRRRTIDFVLGSVEGKRYAIEVEGRTYHQAPAESTRFTQEKNRQRALVLADYLYLPIAYSEIEQGDAQPARQSLLHLVESNAALAHLLGAHCYRDDDLTAGQDAALRLLFESLPIRFPFYQAYAIDLLRVATGQKQTTLEIWETRDDPLLLLAVLDTLTLVERVAQLHGVDLTLPAMIFYRRAANPLYVELVSEYLHAPLVSDGEQPDGRRDRCAHNVTIRTGEDIANYATDAQERAVTAAWSNLHRMFAPEFPDATPLPPHDVQALAPILNYFARRYFPVAELKTEQIQLLQRALAGRSGIAILPTGFGKSLVYQLYALLTPATSLVISPLRSLIHDQFNSMRRIGLGCVHAITNNDTSSVRQWTLRQLAAHRIRLLYISPERLRIKSFYAELFPSNKRTPICALFVDEVHCISEWGHDFRPAYLAIGDLVRRISAARGSNIPVVGLTATASRDVRADILEVLQLAADDVVQLSTSDRANLSLSVHAAGESAQTKTALITELLRTMLPATLDIPIGELLTYPQEEARQYSGVIFGLYADAHGRTMIDEGVHQIAHELRATLGLPPPAVGIHASKAPSNCPHCGFTTYLSRPAKTENNGNRNGARRENWCPNCQTTFEKPHIVDKDAWQEQLENTQDAFYRGDFPIMVATKSYGMGIDKRNIRYIIHHAIAGGMESYYQEAGRAGRDGLPAHVALVCKLPVRHCYDEYLLREASPPCVTVEENLRFFKCPFSASGLCDAGRQAIFIAESYPGIDKDARNVVAVYKELRDRKGAGLQVHTRSGDSGESNVENQKDLALHRLQQLGLILNYTKEYQPNNFVHYDVERAQSWTAQSVAAKLADYLARSGLAPEAVESALQPLRGAEFWLTGRKSPESRYEFLAAAVSVLLQRVYERVPRMRYTMLSSLLRYAINDQGRCRRLYIRTYFDDQAPDDNYRCEFCDVCHPDLQFDRREAVIPAADRQLEHLIRQLGSILTAFKASELQQVVIAAEAKVAVVSLFEKVNRVLEDDATNVAALFLTGALARRQYGLAGLALERLRFAFAEGERQGLNQAQLSLIIEEMQAVDATAALELINRKGGAFDNQAGLALLEQAVSRTHGSQAEPARSVRCLRRVRGYRSLSAEVVTVAGELQQIHTHLQKIAGPQTTSRD